MGQFLTLIGWIALVWLLVALAFAAAWMWFMRGAREVRDQEEFRAFERRQMQPQGQHPQSAERPPGQCPGRSARR